MVQALPSVQELGQEDFGSQVSPSSTTPLSQVGEQSRSVLALHPAGQQRSPATQVVMAVWLQTTLQVALLPVIWSTVQESPSSQLGQVDGGSQVSPASTTPLPQVTAPPLPPVPGTPPVCGAPPVAAPPEPDSPPVARVPPPP